MIKNISYFLLLALFTSACNSKIKDSNVQIDVEDGTQVEDNSSVEKLNESRQTVNNSEETNVLGFWVGYFEEDTKEHFNEKGVFVDEGFYWNRANKINISIDKITNNEVIGHSVVAGNNRPFKGTLKDGIFHVKEPGTDKYDGEFKFQLVDNKLEGKWTAYKNIDITKRKYSLEKMNFVYNPDVMLEKERSYVDWNKLIKDDVALDDDEFEDWVRKEFASATDLIHSINASNTRLQKKDVENLKKGDLTIIRNTIYARHGYSFKNRPLRVFFDAQSWYIPIHTDIKSEFTELEKENIKILLRYEKNAKEYYDYFGRG